MARIGIFYHADPAGHLPSGIDSFIRGILQWAPADLDYFLFGATTDPASRPVGEVAYVRLGARHIPYLPLINISASARRARIPFTVQFVAALHRLRHSELVKSLDALDFHRIEPAFLFRGDPRPKNLVLHQDMAVLRDPSSDIGWRHLPWLYERLEKNRFNDMQRIYCVRESAVARYRTRYPALAEKFRFVPTWVDTSTFHLLDGGVSRRDVLSTYLPAQDLERTGPVVVSVGRLDRQKDPLLMVEAFRLALLQSGASHLIVVGDGALRPQVEAALSSHDLRDRVTMTGSLPRERIADLLRVSDLFLMSSAYEGMPIAVLEALASGVPVVSTPVGELGRVVRNGVNGYLSRSRSPKDLAQSLLLAMEHLNDMRGSPCATSVLPYHPEAVLTGIYVNHRQQTAPD